MKQSKKEKLFSRLAREWIGRTWLGWWRIDVVFLSGKEYRKRMKGHSVAFCATQWQYMEATVYVNSAVLKGIEKDRIEYVVVHELMHVFLNEMREKGIEHEERVATFLARSFMLVNR